MRRNKPIITILVLLVLCMLAIQQVQAMTIEIITNFQKFSPVAYAQGHMSAEYITYTIDTPAASVRTYINNSVTYRVVQTWYDNPASGNVPAGDHTYTWDGTDMSTGKPVLDGGYEIHVIAQDPIVLKKFYDARYNIVIDSKPPVTTAQFDPSYRTWFNNNVKITFTANDANGNLPVAGYDFIWYEIDTNTHTDSSNPLIINIGDEGWHNIKYYSRDRVLNTEDMKSISFGIDKQAPVITCDLSGTPGSDGKYTSDVSITIRNTTADTSGIQSIQYSFDGSTWNPYTSTLIVLFASGETRTIYYKATDNAGNVATPASKTFAFITTETVTPSPTPTPTPGPGTPTPSISTPNTPTPTTDTMTPTSTPTATPLATAIPTAIPTHSATSTPSMSLGTTAITLIAVAAGLLITGRTRKK